MAIIAIGYLLKRTKLLSKQEGQTLNKIILNVTLPALILTTFANMTVEPQLLLLSLICIVYGLLMLFLGRVFFTKIKRVDQGVLTLSLLGFNIGLFAYPFVEGIWGAEGLKYMALFDMGNAFIIFGLAYIVAIFYAPEKKEISIKFIAFKMATFIPLVSYFLALTISFTPVTLPAFTIDILGFISSANAVLVLLVLGIYLEFSFDKALVKPFLKALSLKYVSGLSLGIILFFILPFDELFRATVLLGLVLPTGMAIIPYAVQNQLNDQIAGGIVNITNIISFLIMWVIFLVI